MQAVCSVILDHALGVLVNVSKCAPLMEHQNQTSIILIAIGFVIGWRLTVAFVLPHVHLVLCALEWSIVVVLYAALFLYGFAMVIRC